MIYTTLNKIKERNPCSDGWEKLLKHVGKTKADDEPLSMLTILESNGFDDALWSLRSICQENEKEVCLFAADCAERVLHLFEKQFPDDKRPRLAIQAARDFANGKITDRAAALAALAADAAADAARAARAAALAADAARAAADAARAAALAAHAAYAAYAAYAALAACAACAACAADAARAEKEAQKQLFIQYFCKAGKGEVVKFQLIEHEKPKQLEEEGL